MQKKKNKQTNKQTNKNNKLPPSTVTFLLGIRRLVHEHETYY